MSSKLRFDAIPMSTFDTSGLAGAYAAINGTGTPATLQILKMINNSDTDITISYDGTTDHDFIPAGGDLIVDLQTNAYNSGDAKFVMGTGSIIYAKGSAGTGNLYFIGYY